MQITHFDPAQHTQATVQLWTKAFGYSEPRNAPRLSIQKKLEVNDGLFYVALDNEQVVGTIMAGYDGHRGWLYSLAVSPSFRNQGIGSQLVKHAEQIFIQLGCTKINLQILESNQDVVAFDKTLGYEVEPRINMGKAIPENVS